MIIIFKNFGYENVTYVLLFLICKFKQHFIKFTNNLDKLAFFIDKSMFFD